LTRKRLMISSNRLAAAAASLRLKIKTSFRFD
jgi:hypothetical protein